MGCVWVSIQKVELRHWWEYGDERTGINLFLNSLIPWGLRVPIWKINCSKTAEQKFIFQIGTLKQNLADPPLGLCCIIMLPLISGKFLHALTWNTLLLLTS